MELDPRQGDLFLTLIDGGKPEPYKNYRSKIDALDPKRGDVQNQEGKIEGGQEAMGESRQ